MAADTGKGPSETEHRRQAAQSDYAVILPCAPEDFTEFVSGLLGKAQTIEKVFRGAFEIEAHDIENTFHLVDQRVRQQNEASLVQFTVRIVYDDDSSVVLNGLQDFLHHTEVRPLVSVAAYLSWTYLIKFQDKRFPEKQQIELAIVTNEDNSIVHIEDEIHVIRRFPRFPGNYIGIRISHTARTWGIDVESLLTGHIKTLLRSEAGLKRFISKNSGWVGFGFGALFFLLSMLGAYLTASRFVGGQVAAAESLLKSQGEAGTTLTAKIDFLIQAAARGTWPRFALALSGFFFVSLVLAIGLAVWVGVTAENPPPSFLLISRKAQERRTTVLKKRKREWLKFVISLVTGTATGVAANIIFARLFRAWLG